MAIALLAVAVVASTALVGSRAMDLGGRGVRGYDAAGDPSFIRNVTTDVGAEQLWAQGITGAGVDVALIDTGVVPVAGLDGADKVVSGPDLSFERFDEQLEGLDTNGHGTHMAGIIAGRSDDFSLTDPTTFAGVAPDARIVSIKVADNTGAVDVSQVIAALDWVVQFGQTDGRDIRVVNLSYMTDSTLSYVDDPLARAVENAWAHGIVVVVAAGNGGEGQLGHPALDPYVITVGSTEVDWAGLADENTASSFSASADSRSADVAAPGGGVVGLRAPGARIDLEYPEARRGEQYFRGFGTSQATAVVSGSAALLLQQRPELTPDQVKKLLVDSAEPMPGFEATMGAGEIDVYQASLLATPDYVQTWPTSTGTGSLEASRGSSRLVAPDGAVLEGEVTFTGRVFDAAEWAEASASGAAWSNSSWSNSSWSNSSWSNSSWSNSSWSNSSWSNSSWSNSSWSNSSWSNSSWSNSSWSNSSWSNSSWSNSSWSNSSWSSVTWN